MNNMLITYNVIIISIEPTQLLSYLLQDGNSVNIAYFNFHRAFDSIPYGSLLLSYGIDGKLHRCMVAVVHEFLTNSQGLCYKELLLMINHLAGQRCIMAYTMQGSVLDPILFLLFVNDIASFTSILLLLFVDTCQLAILKFLHAGVHGISMIIFTFSKILTLIY